MLIKLILILEQRQASPIDALKFIKKISIQGLSHLNNVAYSVNNTTDHCKWWKQFFQTYIDQNIIVICNISTKLINLTLLSII